MKTPAVFNEKDLTTDWITDEFVCELINSYNSATYAEDVLGKHHTIVFFCKHILTTLEYTDGTNYLTIKGNENNLLYAESVIKKMFEEGDVSIECTRCTHGVQFDMLLVKFFSLEY